VQLVDKILRRQEAVIANDVEKTLLPEELTPPVHGLGDAVGVDQQNIALVEGKGIRLDGVAEKVLVRQRDADGKAVRIEIIGFVAGAAVEDHRIVAGAGVVDASLFGIDDDVKQGDEHALFHVRNHKFIHACQHFSRVLDAARLSAQRSAYHGHDQRARNALARNIRDDNTQSILVHLDKIVIVSTHLFGGSIIAADPVALDLGKFARQQGLLNLLGDLHLFLQPFLFGHVDLRFPQLQGDIAESLGDLADLGRGIDIHLVGGAGLAELLHPFGEAPKGIHDQNDEQKKAGGADQPDQTHQPGIAPVFAADFPADSGMIDEKVGGTESLARIIQHR